MGGVLECIWIKRSHRGVMDQVASCMGRQGSMLEILCQTGPDGLPAQVLGNIAIPAPSWPVGVSSAMPIRAAAVR